MSDTAYTFPTWWEHWWAKLKLWHTPCMAERYFAMVINEFNCLIEPAATDAAGSMHWKKAHELMAHIEQQIRQRRKLHLTEVFGLEMLVLRLLPVERMLSRAWSIRDAYRRLVPDDMYRKYEESKPPALYRDREDYLEAEALIVKRPRNGEQNAAANPKGDTQPEAAKDGSYEIYLSKVRADAEDILTATHWWYTNSNYREERIQGVKRKMAWLLFLFVLLFIPLLSLSTTAMQSTMLLTVAITGMTGAIFSISRRILPVSSQDITNTDPVIRATQFDHGGTGINLSILIGGASAVVLYIFMMGVGLHVIDGYVMPKPTLCTTDCLSLADFYRGLMPADKASFAMVICWSFIAGFAEMFVPDILDRMAKNGKTK